ncbi:MAG: hypothetical protein ACYDA6_01110 [Solirubrobacteraceae bacterium]
MEAAVAASEHMRAGVADQRRAVQAIRAAAVPAPPALRAALAPRRTSRVPVRARALTVGVAAALALALALVLAVFLPGGGPGTPSLADAVLLAARPATATVPVGNTGHALPGVRAAGLPYPYWQDRFGWEASGVRRDAIGDRHATTVFYRHAGEVIAYTIVSGPLLGLPSDASTVMRGGIRMEILNGAGRTVVVWPRHGHTCLLSGAGVPSRDLVALVAGSSPRAT